MIDLVGMSEQNNLHKTYAPSYERSKRQQSGKTDSPSVKPDRFPSKVQLLTFVYLVSCFGCFLLTMYFCYGFTEASNLLLQILLFLGIGVVILCGQFRFYLFLNLASGA